MPAFNSTHPTAEHKFAGINFSVPYVFAAGHALTAKEATFLNRTVASTIGNQYAGDIRRVVTAENEKRAAQHKAKTYTGPMDESGKKPAPFTADDLTWDHAAEFADKFTGYELGVSNRGGDGESSNPLDRKIKSLATEAVNALLKRNNLSVHTFQRAPARDPEAFTSRHAEMIAEYIDKNPWVRDQAQAQLDALAEHAGGDVEIDLTPPEQEVSQAAE